MHLSEAIGTKHYHLTISPDFMAVFIMSVLGLAISAAVFPMLALYDLESLLSPPL